MNTQHRSSSNQHGFGRRLRTGAACVVAIGGAVFLGGAATLVTAFANTGTVTASESCTTWSASVTLNNNVTTDKFVDVVTTIPGTTGLADHHYDATFGLIWSHTGTAPATGTVTVNIYNAANGTKGGLESTDFASLVPVSGCLSTTASAGGPVGTAIHDTATVSGPNPSGTVVFTLFPDTASCKAGTGALYTSPAEALSSSAPFTATSGAYTPTTVGTFEWLATYTPAASGDAHPDPVVSVCGAEPVTIAQALPSVATTASAGGVAPLSVHDTATVTGGSNPTGTVVFTLYPDATSCASGTGALYTSPAMTLVGGSATSGEFSLTAAGTDQWVARYSGDANNAAASSACGAEPVTVTAATTGGGGGVLGIATPATGAGGSLTATVIGWYLMLGGLVAAIAGGIALRPRRTS